MITTLDCRFNEIFKMVHNTTGINLPEEHIPAVERFLTDRFEELKLSCTQYMERLQETPSELEKLINHIMINETYFFREEKQFRLISNSLFSRLEGDAPLRFWSATCSTGEEAVSLALTAHEFLPEEQWKDLTIFATDINSEDLSKFKKGRYTKRSFKKDGESFHGLFDLDDKGNYILPDDYINRIQISRLNLYSDDVYDFPELLDLIFFRNTLIYYDSELKISLLNKVISRLKPGGYLFVSISEVPFVPLIHLELMEQNNVYFFRKKQE